MWPFPPEPVQKTIKSVDIVSSVKTDPNFSRPYPLWDCEYPYECNCNICKAERKAGYEIELLEKQAEVTQKAQEELENREFGLGFKPWKEIEKKLPKLPAGYHWEMSLIQDYSTAKYFDWTGSDFINWDDTNKAKDTYIVIKMMYGIKEKFTRRINITGKEGRSEYTEFYKNKKQAAWRDIVITPTQWAEAMVDSIQIEITPITKRIG